MDSKKALADLYTTRWHLNNAPTEVSVMLKHVSSAISNLEGKAVAPPVVMPDPAHPQVGIDPTWKKGAGLDTIPFAHQSVRRLPTQGTYLKGYPRGAVVHFTAGHYSQGKQNAINDINVTKYTFLCIANDGTLVQGHPVKRWGYHAGESAWKNALASLALIGSVSDDLIGIEMNNAGLLTQTSDGKFKTWYGDYVPASEVRYVTESAYGCPTGYYHKYTPVQEATLIKTLLWLYQNDPVGCFSFDHVLGHHEVSGKAGIGYFRKSDPGGSLSMPMAQLRALLKSLV